VIVSCLASLRTVAYALVDESVGRNTLANVFVGMALAAAIIVIIILAMLLPDMLHIARDVTTP
jgi:zinc transporter ZupT